MSTTMIDSPAGDPSAQQDVRIASVSVEGLHDQFDVELSFKAGLNILYGKNGTGKTTILHLLANALELDFTRFAYLRFHRIEIRNNHGDAVTLTKEEDVPLPRIMINNSLTFFSPQNPRFSEAELGAIRKALGGRPTYLPAFRSVLERTRTLTQASSYRERREPDFEEIVEHEMAALREMSRRSGGVMSFERTTTREEAAATAQKTLLCRQWFGQFVPIIRYPSVADVEDALAEEWRNAQIEITRREQRMFEETFVKVFRIVAGIESPTSVENNDDLLASIAKLLGDQESPRATTASRDSYNSLLQAARSINSKSVELRGIDNSLLGVYRQVLEKRNTERRVAFQRSREFEESVNKFLDKKALKIGQEPPRMKPVVVSTESGHSYSLAALSSGERQILTMLYSASRTKFTSGIFLIDEPELSLHIDWQRIVLHELQDQSAGRQIIACTHSPEVGADHFAEIKDFDPKPTRQRQATLFSDEEL